MRGGGAGVTDRPLQPPILPQQFARFTDGAMQRGGYCFEQNTLFAAALEESPMLSGVELRETKLEETEGLKLSAFKMTAQYPYLKEAPAPTQPQGRKAQRRGARAAAGVEK